MAPYKGHQWEQFLNVCPAIPFYTVIFSMNKHVIINLFLCFLFRKRRLLNTKFSQLWNRNYKSNTRKITLFGETFIKHFNTIFNSKKKITWCIFRVFRQRSQTGHVVKLIYFTLKFKTPFYLLLYGDLFRKKCTISVSFRVVNKNLKIEIHVFIPYIK